MTNLVIAVNNDTSDAEYGSSGIDWTDLDLSNDSIIFTAGSNTVKDGEALPSIDDLNQAGMVLTGAEIIVSKYLLTDFSANQLKEIHNMGNQNKRYVLAFDFDGATASEPLLEAWDDTNMNTINNSALGSGVPVNSWVKAVTTTYSSPGTNWIGTTMAGASEGYFLRLNNNNGALTGADTLYCNLKLVIPATQVDSGAEAPILVCKYTTN